VQSYRQAFDSLVTLALDKFNIYFASLFLFKSGEALSVSEY